VDVEVIAERVAHNQSAFREANEQIEASALEIGAADRRLPFICECPERACTAVTQLSVEEYEHVRSRGIWFLAVPGHEVCNVAGETVAKVAERHETFTLMEKLGQAGEEAAELDPRQ
jgi:hypothetical protein